MPKDWAKAQCDVRLVACCQRCYIVSTLRCHLGSSAPQLWESCLSQKVPIPKVTTMLHMLSFHRPPTRQGVVQGSAGGSLGRLERSLPTPSRILRPSASRDSAGARSIPGPPPAAHTHTHRSVWIAGGRTISVKVLPACGTEHKHCVGAFCKR